MNYTESFGEFASKVTPTDLALYAGAGLVLWVLFKDKLSPVQQFLANLVSKAKENIVKKSTPSTIVIDHDGQVIPSVVSNLDKEDVFFKLVVSWKQTRDLAVASNCTEAVKVADQMFPYLSPNVCGKEKV
jgi:hypothetical protein